MAKPPNLDDTDIAVALGELIHALGGCGPLEKIVRLRVLSELSAALNTDSLLDLAAMVTDPKPARTREREAERRPSEAPSFHAHRG